MSTVRNEEVTATAVADAAGNATVVFNGPPRGSTALSSIAVVVSPSTPIPQARAYSGPSPQGGRLLATLRAGDAGTFRADAGDKLQAGQQLCVQWTGAAVGATCQAILRGTTTMP